MVAMILQSLCSDVAAADAPSAGSEIRECSCRVAKRTMSTQLEQCDSLREHVPQQRWQCIGVACMVI